MGTLRVIAGRWRGRRLSAGPDRGVSGFRPTADRVRTSLFDRLTPLLRGARVLDLCAGTGALGIEALSRGAAHVTFVESSPAALRLLAANLASLEAGEPDETTVHRNDALHALDLLARNGERFDLVLADPPYGRGVAPQIVTRLDGVPLLAPGGRLVVEHDRRETLPEVSGRLVRLDEKPYGDTRLTFYRENGDADSTLSGHV